MITVHSIHGKVLFGVVGGFLLGEAAMLYLSCGVCSSVVAAGVAGVVMVLLAFGMKV